MHIRLKTDAVRRIWPCLHVKAIKNVVRFHKKRIHSKRPSAKETLETETYRAFSLTWPAAMQIYWNKLRTLLHKKRKENSHRIGLGHQHGRRFIILGNQYGRRDVM